MGKVRRLILGLVAILAIPLIIYFLILIFSSLDKGYSWSEMDWDDNGETSIGEFLLAGDTDARIITFEGKSCREIFAFKDGLPLKTICTN